MSDFQFNYLFIKRFTKLFIYLNKYCKTFIVLIFLLTLSLLQECIVYNIGMITAAYYKILGERDVKQFWSHTIKALLLIIGQSIVKSSNEYVASVLYVDWRQRLTKRMHSLYFMDIFYYRINVIDTKIDNPDQRLTQDTDKMCYNLSLVIPDIIVSPFTIAFYAYRSYTIIGYTGPVGCFVYFLIGTVINKFLMSPNVNLIYQREKCEGNFRYQHMHVRSNAESIAFLNGGDREYHQSEKCLQKLISIQEKSILWEYILGFSTTLFAYSGSIISFMVLAFPLFSGKYDYMSPTEISQLIGQNVFISMYLIHQFTRIVNTSEKFTIIAGTTHRISQMIEYLLEKKNRINLERVNSSGPTYASVAKGAQIYVKVNNVSIKIPQSNITLLNNLNFQICKNTNLFITGASGTCKTSILRMIKGLWRQSNGFIERLLPFDDPNIVMFLPQKPLMTIGSLLEQVTYPTDPGVMRYHTNDEKRVMIVNYMRSLSLGSVLDRVNNEIEREVQWNWNDCLSPGEMQRLSFVRLFYHKPIVAFLDEATSAMPLSMERKIFDECKKLNITLISCGHRDSLAQYHHVVLRIEPNNDHNNPSVNTWILEKL